MTIPSPVFVEYDQSVFRQYGFTTASLMDEDAEVSENEMKRRSYMFVLFGRRENQHDEDTSKNAGAKQFPIP
jgi:hypothetical protein